MPRFCANLSMMFADAPLVERFGRAARAGFRAVEVQFPYELPAATIAAELRGHGLELVLHNLPAGDFAAGERGLASDPARVAEFRDGVARGLDYARRLGVGRLNCLAGNAPPGADAALLRRTLVANLRWAAGELAQAGITLLVEPLNRHDNPRYWLDRSALAFEILDEVGAPNALLQFDCYHAHRSEGGLVDTLTRRLARIGHVQVADHPGRHEPGSGEIDYAALFRLLDRIGWQGHVGCEYIPAAGTEAGLGWMQRLVGG